MDDGSENSPTLVYFKPGLENKDKKVQQFSGWLSKNCDRNPCMDKIFNSKSPQSMRGLQCLDNQPENC